MCPYILTNKMNCTDLPPSSPFLHLFIQKPRVLKGEKITDCCDNEAFIFIFLSPIMLESVWFFDRVRTVIKKKTELKQRRARMGQKKKYLDAESCRKQICLSTPARDNQVGTFTWTFKPSSSVCPGQLL